MSKVFYIKISMAVVLCMLLVKHNLIVNAKVQPWNEETYTVGGTTVTVEVGYVNDYGYVTITATDFIDVDLTGSITYTDASGQEVDKYFSYRKDETSYCQTVCYGDGPVKFTECDIEITSVDGYMQHAHLGTE